MAQPQLESVFLQSETEAAEALANLLHSQVLVRPESPLLLHQSEEKTIVKPRRLRSKIAVKRKASSSVTRMSQKNAASSTSINSNSNSFQSPPQIASGKPDELCTEKFFLMVFHNY